MKRHLHQDCPVCKARGKVPSRLPFRFKLCPKCGGRGRIIPLPHYAKRKPK
jgi:DnaJ-class molecular chaperone